MAKLSYEERLRLYEVEKRRIQASVTDPKEYERRIREVIKKYHI